MRGSPWRRAALAHRQAAFRCFQGLRTTTPSAKRTGEGCRCSPGLDLVGVVVQGAWHRGPAASRGGARGKSLQRGDPGFWVAWANAGRHCEAGRGVSGIRRTTAARNRAEADSPTAATSGAISALHRPKSEKKGLARTLGARRGCCGGWQGLEGRGVAGLWWRRGPCAVEQCGARGKTTL